jgi:ATP-dependent helicase YprA (DUF1998 family)
VLTAGPASPPARDLYRSRLLANLRYVVVDEGHAYRGVFGCHAALVLRRLRRLCDRVYHSQPTFAVATATLANPREHACELLGVPEVEGQGQLACAARAVLALRS